MEKYQEQAWDCLTEDEQNSLFLNVSKGLSTWQTSELLKITHYKYLELKARAEKFFKMFSDYFEKHPSLIRPQSPLEVRFEDYLYGSILKRLSKEDAQIYAGDSSFLLVSIKNPIIIRNMEKLKRSEDPWDQDLYKLIMEFDRWNNYRILPRILQAPSPYKRRTTKKDKIYLRYLHNLPDFKIRALVDMYWCNGKPENRYYCMMISEIFDGGYGVVPIKRDPKIIEELTNLKIYIFEKQLDAEEYALMVKMYFEKTTDPRSGMKYWKRYRELIETSINYRSIKNIDFSCENLDMAYNLKRNSISKMTKIKKKLDKD